MSGHDASETRSVRRIAAEQLVRAKESAARRSAVTVCGGSDRTLRQTVIALAEGTVLAEHENPGEATVYVLSGGVRLRAGDEAWEGRQGDLIVVPRQRHDLIALQDATVLLTVAAGRP
ncbi:MAG TPA: cupin domain-containing protein [Mycobacteriales bacterium]|nr:cupin domain-containing protein [Mycobacteriales bacterium]